MWQLCSNQEIEAEPIGGAYMQTNHYLRDPLTGVLLRINGGKAEDGRYIEAEERARQLADLLNKAEFGIEPQSDLKIVAKQAK